MPNLRIGKRLLVLCLTATGGAFSACGGSPVSPGTLVPVIATISPTSANGGGAAFTLTVNGTNFVATSVVSFGGTARPTTFVSGTQLTVAIPAAAVATAGTAPVTVTNPGGGVSNQVNFSITLQPVDPMDGQYALSVTVDSLGPECATLPDEAKHRMYTASIAARSDGNFVVSLSGGRFLSDPVCTGGSLSGLDCNQFLAYRVADTVGFSLLSENGWHGGQIVEQIPQIGWMELTGNLTSPVNNDMMSARGEGNLWFCPGTAGYPFPCVNA